jgi:hypothetical protein
MTSKATKLKRKQLTTLDPKTLQDAQAEDEAFERIRKKMADAQTAAWMKNEYYDQEDSKKS